MLCSDLKTDGSFTGFSVKDNREHGEAGLWADAVAAPATVSDELQVRKATGCPPKQRMPGRSGRAAVMREPGDLPSIIAIAMNRNGVFLRRLLHMHNLPLHSPFRNGLTCMEKGEKHAY